MAYVYKKFTAQDIAIIPFNAHKQYNFNSASAASNAISHFNTKHTSESVSIYSGNNGNDDTINTIKYNQIDHLFYRDHLKNVSNKKDFTHYLKQRKDYYEKSNLLSIPSGLYGHNIRKKSFYLSSSNYQLVDDTFGNLIISGTNVNDYPNDVQQNVFRLDPIKGFKKYDLDVFDDKYLEVINTGYTDSNFNHFYTSKRFYRQGLKHPESSPYYSTTNINPVGKTFTAEGVSSSIDAPYPPGYLPQDEDDSYFFNPLHYNNVTFNESSLGSSTHKFPEVRLYSTVTSSIKIPNSSRFNFHKNQDFAVSFFMTPHVDTSTTNKRYIITKNGSKTTISDSVSVDVVEETLNHPFEIYIQSQSIFFSRSDGVSVNVISGEVTSSGEVKPNTHILCQQSSSKMQIWFNGSKISEADTSLTKSTRNESNLYIGSRGLISTTDTNPSEHKHYSGSLSNINIWSRAYTTTQITNISESINASPYVGNIFYSSGFATITHPLYHDILSGSVELSGGINTLQFQGSHLIYEHEYQCTVQEHEYNTTTNPSVLKNEGDPYVLEDFTTGSFFKPYVTTIGLYSDGYELLAVAKLGQPIRMSDETDTTFIIRYDT